MQFFQKFAGMVSQSSYSNLKLARSAAERESLLTSLRESKEHLEGADRRKNEFLARHNVDAGQSLADILELDGHRAVLARSGAAGIAIAREIRPDVVLCDLGLPDVSGYDVARTIRADDALRSSVLIALSGYAQAEDRRRASDAGFDTHVAKPPDVEELRAMLAKGR